MDQNPNKAVPIELAQITVEPSLTEGIYMSPAITNSMIRVIIPNFKIVGRIMQKLCHVVSNYTSRTLVYSTYTAIYSKLHTAVSGLCRAWEQCLLRSMAWESTRKYKPLPISTLCKTSEDFSLGVCLLARSFHKANLRWARKLCRFISVGIDHLISMAG